MSRFVDFGGVRWLDRALESAQRSGVAEAASEAARRYLAGEVYGGTSTGDTLRTVPVEGVSAVISVATGLVLGYSELRKTPTAQTPPPRKTKKRKPRSRGPTDRGELLSWLGEGGFTFVEGSRHLSILNPEGVRVATIPATPSDHRGHDNDVSLLRRITGLPLRRDHV
jgi:hypothetical protein